MQVHAVGFGTIDALEEMTTILGRAQTRLQDATVHGQVVYCLYGAQCLLGLAERQVGARARRLRARVRRRRVDHNFEDLAESTEVFGSLEHVGVGESRRQADNEYEVLLHDSHVRQVTTILR